MRAGEANPLDPRDAVHTLQELSEVAGFVIRRLIVVDNLPEELDFAMSRIGRVFHFGQNVRDRPHAFVSSGVRHDAERAEFVASFDNGDPRPYRVAMTHHAEGKRDIVVWVDIEGGQT